MDFRWRRYPPPDKLKRNRKWVLFLWRIEPRNHMLGLSPVNLPKCDIAFQASTFSGSAPRFRADILIRRFRQYVYEAVSGQPNPLHGVESDEAQYEPAKFWTRSLPNSTNLPKNIKK